MTDEIKKGDRVRSIVQYRKGMEGTVRRVGKHWLTVNVESTSNNEPCIVECRFYHGEVEKIS